MNLISFSKLFGRPFAFLIFALFLSSKVAALSESFVSTDPGAQDFPLFYQGNVAPIFLDETDYSGVIKVANQLVGDIQKVTGSKPSLSTKQAPTGKTVILVGTLGKSSLVDQLASSKKINLKDVEGKWDTFGIQSVRDPMPGVDQALVIFGSNKRGTIYGIYELSRQMGVSPWYWWADVPVEKKKSVFVKAGFHSIGEPKVKYRGIFINDEAPALRNWAKEKFGGHNHLFYDHVFELILRNRGNYIWPAMWPPTTFYQDDEKNAEIADEYGIIMGTSHHEPLTRAHDEWSRFNGREWNYETNKEQLLDFWRGGIQRMGNRETLLTMGMRGDGDEAMSEGTAVHLLKTIIHDQRKLLTEVTGKSPEKIPQMWALYKEVQDYYEKGMRVDDDILVLFSDDNWGNIRLLPEKKDINHPGGYGMYYHVDYVGAPVSYRWLNVSQIERIWEQMKLSYQWGVKGMWIVNVGDIKPMELPMSFFLDLAWNPDAISASDLPTYYVDWAKQQFGAEYAKDVAELLTLYTKYNARRTPEMLSATTYSVENYREADRIVSEYQAVLAKAEKIFKKLPSQYKDAYFQLVLYPIRASSNVNEMYVAAAKNEYYATRGAPAANYYADKVSEHFKRDAELEKEFHHIKDGKWNHMMSQTRMGYTYWNHPPLNRSPAVSRVEVKQDSPELGYFIENGKPPKWGWLDVEADWSFSTAMPTFNPINDQNLYIEIINRGKKSLEYSIAGKNDWIKLSSTKGKTQYADKVYVSIDWSKAPKGKHTGKIVISGAGKEYSIEVPIENKAYDVEGFVENDGVVSINAANFHRANNLEDSSWIVIPNLGRTDSSVTPYPSNSEPRKIGFNSPSLEYTFSLLEDGELSLDTYLSPTHNFKSGDGLKFAIAIDDQNPKIVNLNENEDLPDWKYASWWTKAVGEHIKIKNTGHGVVKAGKHKLRVWMIDPGVVIQQFVINRGGLKKSYLGPTQSTIAGNSEKK